MMETPQTASLAHLAGKYMTFKLADVTYGLEILAVREIIGLMNITRVPRAREFIRGVINLRGKVIPVVDLRLQFGMPEAPTTEQTVIIVVQVDVAGRTWTMGLLVDQVLEAISIDASSIEPTPSLAQDSAGNSFILGVGKTGARIVFLLGLAGVLSTDDAGELARAAA
jgi:purine-binding chemotaxis protein CheW